MTHPDPSELLDLALRLVPATEPLRAHLGACAPCAEEFRRLEGGHEELREFYAALEPPPTGRLESRVRNCLSRTPPLRPQAGRRLSLLAASLLLAAAVGWALLVPSEQPRPVPPPPGKDAAAPLQATPEETAAQVNGEVLTWKAVEDRLKGIPSKDVTDALRNSVRRELVEAMLFRQFAARKGVTVTEEEVDQLLQKDVGAHGGRDEYERATRIRYGTEAKAREARRGDLLAFKVWKYGHDFRDQDPELRDLKFESEIVPEGELRKYYDANPKSFEAVERISFMRVALPFSNGQEEEAKRAVLESVRRRYEMGSDFAMLAFFYSELRRAREFRDLGVNRSDLQGVYTPETIRYLFDGMKVGEVSPIVKDGKTLNLFKLEQKVSQAAESFEQAQARIQTLMENGIREKNRKKFRDLLWRQARIDPPDLFED